jgi:excisionase family DNA binding protein
LRKEAHVTEGNPDFASQPTNWQEGAGTRESAFLLRAQILGDDRLLTVKEVAELVGVSTRQIYAMIHRHTFPGPRKLGALSHWRLGLVKSWLHDDGIRRA